MNTSLDKYRDELARMDKSPVEYNIIEAGCYSIGVEHGFDAAIALELPVKYARWKDSVFKGFSDSKSQPDQWKRIKKVFNKIGKSFGEEQLYTYWIENIFKIE